MSTGDEARVLSGGALVALLTCVAVGGCADDSGGPVAAQTDDVDNPAQDQTPSIDRGPSGSAPEPGRMAGMTAAHNRIRAQAAADEPLSPLSWSEPLAAFAQEWADRLAADCGTLMHRGDSEYGENISVYFASPGRPDKRPEDPVEGWAAEAACWNYGTFGGSDRCDPECAADLNTNGCAHFTQIVWRETSVVGCGLATCTADDFNVELWVCNYDPPGNWLGELPY